MCVTQKEQASTLPRTQAKMFTMSSDKREGIYPQKPAASVRKAGRSPYLNVSTTKWSVNVSHYIYPFPLQDENKYYFKAGITKDYFKKS